MSSKKAKRGPKAKKRSAPPAPTTGPVTLSIIFALMLVGLLAWGFWSG